MDIKIRELKYGDGISYKECLQELYPDLKLDKNFDIVLEQRMCIDNLYTYVAVNPMLSHDMFGAGSLILEPKFGHKKINAGYIQDVCVRKDVQKHGVGNKIVNFLIELAKSLDCYKIELTCSNKNFSFYRNLGFTEHQHNMRINL